MNEMEDEMKKRGEITWCSRRSVPVSNSISSLTVSAVIDLAHTDPLYRHAEAIKVNGCTN